MTYPVLDWTPRHEDVKESGGLAPCILNLSTREEFSGQLHVPNAVPPGRSHQ
jgi:hypothetical protein